MGQGFEHRKRWIEQRLQLLAETTAVQCAGFAIMDNHLHLLLRLDSAQAAGWTAEDVAQRWARLFPPKAAKGQEHLNLETWIASHAADAAWVAKTRQRLASLSWFMKCLKEPLARQANREDGCTGAFWEGRFRSVAILDEESLLATCAYIDLNPVAAGLAATPEQSPHTSFRARVEHGRRRGQLAALKDDLSTATRSVEAERGLWLLPIEDGRQLGDRRVGLLPGLTLSCYVRLVDWTSRLVREGKNRVSSDMASIFARLHVDAERWEASLLALLKPEKLVGQYFGGLNALRQTAARLGQRWVKNRGTRLAVVRS